MGNSLAAPPRKAVLRLGKCTTRSKILTILIDWLSKQSLIVVSLSPGADVHDILVGVVVVPPAGNCHEEILLKYFKNKYTWQLWKRSSHSKSASANLGSPSPS